MAPAHAHTQRVAFDDITFTAAAGWHSGDILNV